jgi:hypothetical protein
VRRWQGRRPYLGGEHACQDCRADQHAWTSAQTDTISLPYGEVRLYHYSCACWRCLLRCGAGLVHVDVFKDQEQTMEIIFAGELDGPLPERTPGTNFPPDHVQGAQVTQATTDVGDETLQAILDRLREL